MSSIHTETGLAYNPENVERLAREMFARDYQFNRSSEIAYSSVDEIRNAWESDLFRSDRHRYWMSIARRALTSMENIVHHEELLPDVDE